MGPRSWTSISACIVRLCDPKCNLKCIEQDTWTSRIEDEADNRNNMSTRIAAHSHSATLSRTRRTIRHLRKQQEQSFSGSTLDGALPHDRHPPEVLQERRQIFSTDEFLDFGKWGRFGRSQFGRFAVWRELMRSSFGRCESPSVEFQTSKRADEGGRAILQYQRPPSACAIRGDLEKFL